MIDRARFARHLVLAEIGEDGQERIAAATARVVVDGLAGEVARRYSERAGFLAVEPGGQPAPCELVTHAAASAVVSGSLAALEAIRAAIARPS